MAYTEAELQILIGKCIKIMEIHRQFGNALSPNMIATTDEVYELLEQSRTPQVAAAVGSIRQGHSNLLNPSAGKKMVGSLLREMARVKSYAQTDPKQILRRLLFDYANEGTPTTILDKITTFGAISAGGSNVGTGTVRRLTVDPYGYPIQATHNEVKRFTCNQDRYQGVPSGREEFWYEGVNREPDNLKIVGSGLRNVKINALNGSDAIQYLRNPSWNGADSAFTGWDVTNATTAAELSDTYRTYTGEGTAGAIAITGNGYIFQTLITQRGAFKTDIPYYPQVAWNRSINNTTTMTITVTLGSQTVATVAISGSESGWQVLAPTLDEKLYYQNWRSDAAEFRITTSNVTGGAPVFDDGLLFPMKRLDGLWYAPVGGATPFMDGDRDAGDTFTFDDSVVTGAVLSYWFWQMYGVDGQLPTKTSAPVWAEPLAWA